VKSKVSSDDIKNRIIAAFHRSAQIDADKISVTAKGSAVTLKGNVHTWAEREEAQRATWTAPGVTVVDNQIHIT
jgi:osmotically-inducible protein OsmY